MTDDHRVELPVTFEGGVGTTRAISPDEARFTTRHRLGSGRRIGGTLRFPPAVGGVATELRFAARVLEVAPGLEDERTFDVRVRFERIELRAVAVADHRGHGAAPGALR